jgi:hypothetical protein
MVLPHLIDGSLKEVLPDCNPKPKPISIVYPHNRHLSAKVRVFIDFMLSKFASPPYWDRNWLPSLPAGVPRQDRVGANDAGNTPPKPRSGARRSSRAEST